MSQCACVIMWTYHLLIEVGMKYRIPTKQWNDNQVALHIASNKVSHERIKHIEDDCHFISEKILENFISTGYVKTR